MIGSKKDKKGERNVELSGKARQENITRVKQGFEGIGWQPADSRVRTNGVVEGLYVAKNHCICRATGGKVLQVDTLAFEAGEEVFSHGVVVRVTLTRHTLSESISFQRRLIGGRGILYATVGVKDQTWIGVLTPYSHVQSGEGKFGL